MFPNTKICLTALFIFFSYFEAIAQSAPTQLNVGEPIEVEIVGGTVHTYSATGDPGQYVYIAAEQKGIDIVVRVFSPDGVLILEVNTPTGARGSEPIYFISEKAGGYKIEISPSAKDSTAGKYELKLVESRPANADDRLFATAKNTILIGYSIQTARGPDFEKASHEKFMEAAALYERISVNLQAKASGFSQLATIFRARNKPELSLEYYDKSIVTFSAAGLKRDGMIALVGSTTVTSNNLDRLSRHHRVLAIAREIGEKRTEASALTQIGTTSIYLGDFPTAVSYLREAVRFSRAESLGEHLRQALNNLGSAYTDINDFSSALLTHHEVLALNKELNQTAFDNDTILNIGNVYSRMGNDNLAIETYQKALAGFEARNSPVGISFALNNIGSVYQSMGDTPNAMKYYDRAQVIKDKLFPDDPNRLISMGAIYSSTSRPREALEMLTKGMELCKKRQNSECEARTLIIMSNAVIQLGEFKRALDLATAASEIANRFDYDDHAWAAQFSIARAQIKLGDIAAAKKSLKSSIARIEQIRAKTTLDTSVGGIGGGLRPFRTLIGLLIDEKAVEEALALTEATKARNLIDVVRRTRRSINKSMTASDLASEEELRRQMSSLNSELNSARDSITRDAVNEMLRVKRLEFEAFRTKLYATYPELRVARAELTPIRLSETGDLIPDEKSMVLHFAETDDRLFVFVGTRRGQKPIWKVFPLDITTKQIATKVETFRAKLATGHLDFQQASAELSESLFMPIHNEISGKTHIIIIPDGPLWDLPFQALMDEKGKYLIEKAAVSYAPSLTALREMRRRAAGRKPTADAELLAFGNPTVGAETKQRVQRVFMSEKLEPIPAAERLVNSLAKMYGPKRSKVFVGAEAREEVAKTESPKYRIVQFATHGILNNSSPMYSHLVMAQNDKNLNDDGLLEAWELKDLDLKADLVILSACDTARGKISNGEGVIGMTWASFIAGAPTTVASQWKVESSSTTELMLEFHRQLLAKPRISKAEALRRASLKLMKIPKYRHPSYWAGFVLVGDGS